MLLAFKLAVTCFVIGAIWYVAALIVNIAKGDKLGFDYFVPPILILIVSFFALVVIGIIALWRVI